jgi:hypothetical protein
MSHASETAQPRAPQHDSGAEPERQG